jgi:hypothetical protein
MSVAMMSEAEACRYLGRRVAIAMHGSACVFVGRLSHVSSTKAFVVTHLDGVPVVHALRLADIEGIDVADLGSVA